ncbi:MAG: protein YgfX [Nitrosomonadales bacterium]
MLKSFSLKPSRIYFILLLAMHALVVTSIFLTNLPLWARAGIACAVVLNGLYQPRTVTRWRSFTLDKTRLEITSLSGEAWVGELCSRTVVIPLCVVLCVRPDGRSRPVCQVIFSDAMDAENFRDLRVRLTWDR